MALSNFHIWFICVTFWLPQLYGSKIQPRQFVHRPNALRNFEVREPSVVPTSQPCEKILLEHTFENSYGRPAKVDYSPPAECGPPGSWASVIFNLTTTSLSLSFIQVE
uniref:Peptide N-acetyl-beta-D-glucosaminyl asparaginase amidase A N-terminal domain-containing protein n=1 Tax=Phakopsora pachyrhizi TaxID=170000 RepID=A0A0S1MJ66_PHAPC